MAIDTDCPMVHSSDHFTAIPIQEVREMAVKPRFAGIQQNVSRTVTFVPVFCFAALMVSGSAWAGAVAPQPRSGEPLEGLTQDELVRFQLGKAAFEHTFSEPEGLGPIFNKQSCGNCHNNRVGGTGSQAVTRFGRTDKGVFDPLAELGGSLLQVNHIQSMPTECAEVVPPVPDVANVVSQRVTNGAMAFGLVEAIPDAAIEAVHDAQPLAQQGTIHYVYPFETPKTERVGRFGWKAQVATVLTFSADAAQNELGLSNRFVPFDNAPNGNQACLDQYDLVADPEDGPEGGVPGAPHFIDRVTDFQRFLSQPPQTPKSGMSGEALFTNPIASGGLGCAVCHTPSYTTSNDPGLEDAIRNKAIRPYSDWMLHYMGQTGDFIVQGAGIEGFVKTPPLWNLRKRDPMWHDGRFVAGTLSTRVNAAINAHNDPPIQGSQGKDSALAFAALSQEDKDKVIAFLDSLGRREFDMADSLSDEINIDDFIGFADCYTGAGVNYARPASAMDHPCAVSDIDQDADVDLDDFDSFMLVYTGARRDCNGNGIVDLRDILTGVSTDADSDGLPDSCEPTCDQDLNGTGTVNVDDLLGVINQWGNCPSTPAPCGADVNLDEVVNVDDLLSIINGWGPC
jgi:CxxC motif-containing protein (DUF1111 family)